LSLAAQIEQQVRGPNLRSLWQPAPRVDFPLHAQPMHAATHTNEIVAHVRSSMRER
jgi:hypothetical protein